jgi:hypothetical protein
VEIPFEFHHRDTTKIEEINIAVELPCPFHYVPSPESHRELLLTQSKLDNPLDCVDSEADNKGDEHHSLTDLICLDLELSEKRDFGK